MHFDKPALIAAFRLLLEARLRTLEAGGDAARAGTRVDGSHRPATRGERGAVTAQGFLALGLAERAATLRDDLRLLAEVDASDAEVVRAGALVTLHSDSGREERIRILPGGAGDHVEAVMVLSPAAPLTRALRGREEGEVVEVERGGRTIELEIVQIC